MLSLVWTLLFFLRFVLLLLMLGGGDRRLQQVESFSLTASSSTSNKHVVAAAVSAINKKKDPFVQSMDELGWSTTQQQKILISLQNAGLWELDNSFENEDADSDNANSSSIPSARSDALLTVCCDYRPDQIAKVLIDDFRIQPLMAHHIRAAVVQTTTTTTTMDKQQQQQQQQYRRPNKEVLPENKKKQVMATTKTTAAAAAADLAENKRSNDKKKKSYRSLIVNDAAAKRRLSKGSSTIKNDYGLPKNCTVQYPLLSQQLNEFYVFMTQPTTLSQEDPIRAATADIYFTHSRLFLGWYINIYTYESDGSQQQPYSIYDIIPNKSKESATPLIDFILWLRSERQISHSYEANLLRGLTKLLKYRFCGESNTNDDNDSSNSVVTNTRNTYQDIPVVNEIRKLHRVANRKQVRAPRSSNETNKWISWIEFLQVVQAHKKEAELLLDEYYDESTALPRQKPITNADDIISDEDDGKTKFTYQERQIATALQRYLVLAIFASIPDRQRTVRELELGRTFVYDDEGSGGGGGGGEGCWCIRHSPEDYKTGKAYGERPPMHLPASLTSTINLFVNEWRRCFQPRTNMLFAQPKTGKPLTRDSVYHIVVRACYKCTGKRTNPHLLRDMIVTHVRGSTDGVSEKELEALALFMGHSLNMQRTSYDRRTMSQKVQPAIRLLETINNNDTNNKGQN